MNCACDSRPRATYVQTLAREFSLKSAMRLVHDIGYYGNVRFADGDNPYQQQVTAAIELLNDALNSSISMPQKCKPEDCVGCFWYDICEMWGFYQLIRESEQILKDARELQRKQDQERDEALRKPQTLVAKERRRQEEIDAPWQSIRASAISELTKECSFLDAAYLNNLDDYSLFYLRTKLRLEGQDGVRFGMDKLNLKKRTGQVWRMKDDGIV